MTDLILEPETPVCDLSVKCSQRVSRRRVRSTQSPSIQLIKCHLIIRNKSGLYIQHFGKNERNY